MFDNLFGPGGEPRGYTITKPDGTTDVFNDRNEYQGQVNTHGAYGPGGEYLGNSPFDIIKPK